MMVPISTETLLYKARKHAESHSDSKEIILALVDEIEGRVADLDVDLQEMAARAKEFGAKYGKGAPFNA